jgi:hypothetical protein
MGRIAAENLAAQLGYGDPAPRTFPTLIDFRIIDGGSAGAVLTSRGEEYLQHTAQQLTGTAAHELKESAEQFLIWRLRTGHVDDLGKGMEQRRAVTA